MKPYSDRVNLANPSNNNITPSPHRTGNDVYEPRSHESYRLSNTGNYVHANSGLQNEKVPNFVPPQLKNPEEPLPSLNLYEAYDSSNSHSNNQGLTIKAPIMSHQVIGGSGNTGSSFTVPVLSDQVVAGNRDAYNTGPYNHGPRNYMSKVRAPVPNSEQTSKGTVNKQNSQSKLPATVQVQGDPDKDSTLAVKVSTPEKVYDINLNRFTNNILHEDVKFLTVSVDENGKTVFKEQFKTVG